jgi:hypothetical protein
MSEQCAVVAEANRLVPGARCDLPKGHKGHHSSDEDGYIWAALNELAAAEPEHVEVAPAVQDGAKRNAVDSTFRSGLKAGRDESRRRIVELEAALTQAREALQCAYAFAKPFNRDGDAMWDEAKKVIAAALAASQPGSTQ